MSTERGQPHGMVARHSSGVHLAGDHGGHDERSGAGCGRWRRVTRHHDDLRAEIQHRYESVYSAIAQQQNFSPAQQEKLRWVFEQIDQVLERRRAQDLAAIHPLRASGRWVLGPVLLAAIGIGLVVAAALLQP